MSLATLSGEDVGEVDSRQGLTVGAALTFPLSGSIGLQVGGSFTQKGAEGSEGGVDFTIALDYIEVPVLLRLGIPLGAFSPHLLVGGAVSYEASCEFEGSAQGTTATLTCEEADLASKSIDFGGVVGAGIGLVSSPTLSVTVEALYNLGLSTIDDSELSADIKNRAWSFLAGVAFPIG